MRIIKFRALKDDMSDYKWVYGNLVYSVDNEPRIQQKIGDLLTTCLKGTESQFTGLKDKNGVEIYEGDIVKSKRGTKGELDFLSEVRWDKDSASFEYYGITRNDDEGNFTEMMDEFTPEVVGNKFEKLLKGLEQK